MPLTTSSDVFVPQLSLHPQAERWLRQSEALSGFAGMVAIIIRHGFRETSPLVLRLIATTLIASMLTPVVSLIIRYVWSLTRSSYLRDNAINSICCGIWLLGILFLVLGRSLGASWSTGPGDPTASAAIPFLEILLNWTTLVAFVRGIYELAMATQSIARAGLNPALVLVVSFVVLIGLGLLLLMLPICRPESEASADWLTALFTSTSACCVTGLVVTDTGTYWSREGQLVIMLLIQFGGLGIMTFGAFFALIAGRDSMREAATMRDLLDSDRMSDVSSLVKAILVSTLLIEFLGAILLSGLWINEPIEELVFQSVFHSVSAFCNAGFSTRGPNLTGWETRWQVWGVVASLIILGGFGFGPMENIWRYMRRRRWLRSSFHHCKENRPVRISLSTRLVVTTTVVLLVGGTVVLLGLEWNNPAHPTDPRSQFANAWFHSVTLRTAGFNTVDHSKLTPASKIFGIMLMFVGASPGSTGGGVKTITLALAVLTMKAVLRGRTTVEVSGRTIPVVQIYRGLAVIALALTVLMVAAIAIIVIEDKPELVLDHIYETASALGTVGVSAGVTAGLQPASKLILIVTMFLGRVGALTLVAALAGTTQEANYQYPEERITLG